MSPEEKPLSISQNYERPPKEAPRDVIDYEIEMMEHCAKRVLESEVLQGTLERDQLAFLEAFLLHFRILIEFFGTPAPRFKDNLYFQKPETYWLTPSPETLAVVKKRADALDEQWSGKLNKFLAHPTERRYTTKRSWPVERMREEMRDLTDAWRSLVGQRSARV